MKRLMIAVLLFAASAIPTSTSAVDYDTQLHVAYYMNGVVVGQALYSSCWGSNWMSGQQGGELKREKVTRCDDGSLVYCRWYSWNGYQWELLYTSSCSMPSGWTRPDRPLP